MASLSVLLLLCSFIGTALGTGESCSSPHIINVAGVVSSSGEVYTQSIDTTQSASSVADIPTCTPVISGSQTNGTYWFRWTPTVDQNVFFTLTGPKVDEFSDVTTFQAKLSLISNPNGTDCSTLQTAGSCILRIADMCQGYPANKLPASQQVLAGVTYFIVVDRPKAGGGGLDFQFAIYPSPGIYVEKFDTTALPATWSTGGPAAAGAFTTDNVGFVFGTTAQVSSAPTLVFPASPSGSFAAVNPYKACQGQGLTSCDLTATYLTAPPIELSEGSAVLTFDCYFFDGYVFSHQVVEHSATIEISSVQNSTWGLLFTIPSDPTQWVSYSVSLNAWAAANDTITLRFKSDVIDAASAGAFVTGFGIDNFQILSSEFDMCSDDLSCTTDTCSAAANGCGITPSDDYCTGLHADCEESVCDPYGTHDTTGCSTEDKAGFCDDSKTCTIDECDPEDSDAHEDGCVYTEDTAVCDDGKGCTSDFCIIDPTNTSGDPITGCIFPPSCDDAISCTIDECVTITDVSTNTTVDYCEHTIDVFSCDDGIGCTYELLCEVERSTFKESGCIRVPMDAWCDDGDPCTIDICDPTRGGCFNTELDCDDEIACTFDYCNVTSGECIHQAIHTFCDDFVACTEDICDESLGKCVNVPHDDWCPTENCFLPTCDPAGTGAYPNNKTVEAEGCDYRLIVCDDDIACTIDFCDTNTNQCEFRANDTLCVDDLECTDDTCDASIGRCTNIPNSDNCDDSDDCTIDVCGANGMCTHDQIDCDDEVYCTLDYCEDGECKHDTQDSECVDEWGCTVDFCDAKRGCVNINNDSDCFTSLCKIEWCNPLSSPDSTGCVREDKICLDEIECTDNHCDPSNGECYFTANDTYCEDDHHCTVDTCDVVKGMCTNIPSDALCDDSDACTTDACLCDGDCEHVEKDCTDEIACSVDSCNPTNGECIHDAHDELCNDAVDCTDDECDLDLGRCTNIPNDRNCEDDWDCTVDWCDAALGGDGCHHDAVDDECNDNVFCTLDRCKVDSGCHNYVHHDLCDDGNDCTEDLCHSKFDCQHITHDEWCDDGIDCTIDRCDNLLGCIHVPMDNLCDDDIECTHDHCSLRRGECVHRTDNELCSDGIACTLDVCDAVKGCLAPHPVHAWCEDGFACSADWCNYTVGCQVDYSACPWSGLNSGDQICLNCLTQGTAIQEICYHDGKGAMQLQTKSGDDGLMTNLFLSPFGQVVVGSESQEDVRLAADDNLVVNGNVRLSPVATLPACNEVHRGLIVVNKQTHLCGVNRDQECENDVVYICLKERTYEWRELADGSDRREH